MPKNRLCKIFGFVFIILLPISLTGCGDLGKSAANLIYGKYGTPTSYVTPLLQGTANVSFTPYPQVTPVVDKESCTAMEGYAFRLELQIQYSLFKKLRGTTGGTSRKDMPPIIDEMRKIHSDVWALELPEGCEIFTDLQYHLGADIDQTIRALVSFRNSEPDEVMTDYFNEASAHEAVVEEILSMTN
jgi:hypothetical protein